LTRYYS